MSPAHQLSRSQHREHNHQTCLPSLVACIGIIAGIASLTISSEALARSTNGMRAGIPFSRDAATTGNFNLDGGWGYTMHSNVSGQTHVGSLTLKRDGSHVTGTFTAFDNSNSDLDGSYDTATGTLKLSRDTGLDTIQTFTLRRIGGKLTGTFRNKGTHPDSGTIEFRRMTL